MAYLDFTFMRIGSPELLTHGKNPLPYALKHAKKCSGVGYCNAILGLSCKWGDGGNSVGNALARFYLERALSMGVTWAKKHLDELQK